MATTSELISALEAQPSLTMEQVVRLQSLVGPDQPTDPAEALCRRNIGPEQVRRVRAILDRNGLSPAKPDPVNISPEDEKEFVRLLHATKKLLDKRPDQQSREATFTVTVRATVGYQTTFADLYKSCKDGEEFFWLHTGFPLDVNYNHRIEVTTKAHDPHAQGTDLFGTMIDDSPTEEVADLFIDEEAAIVAKNLKALDALVRKVGHKDPSKILRHLEERHPCLKDIA